MNFFAPTPPGDRYACICLDPGERMTQGGLYLPDKHVGKMMRWLVVSVGPGKWSSDGSRRLRPQWKEGDVLLAYKLSTFPRIPGSKASGGHDIHIISEDVFVGAVTGVEWETVPGIAPEHAPGDSGHATP